MKRRSDLDATDIVYFPATFLVSFLLSRWLPSTIASAIAVMLMLTILYLITRATGGNAKGFLLPVLAAGIVAFVLGLVGWPQ